MTVFLCHIDNEISSVLDCSFGAQTLVFTGIFRREFYRSVYLSAGKHLGDAVSAVIVFVNHRAGTDLVCVSLDRFLCNVYDVTFNFSVCTCQTDIAYGRIVKYALYIGTGCRSVNDAVGCLVQIGCTVIRQFLGIGSVAKEDIVILYCHNIFLVGCLDFLVGVYVLTGSLVKKGLFLDSGFLSVGYYVLNSLSVAVDIVGDDEGPLEVVEILGDITDNE